MSIFEILLLVNSGLWIILALTFIIFLILRSASFARLNRYLAEPTPVSRRYDMGNLEDFYKRNKEEIEKHADEFPTEAPCLFSNFPFREDIAKERKNKLEEKKDEESPRSEYISPVVEVKDEPSPESEVAQ